MNDLLFTQGNDNLSGLVGELYHAPSKDILTLPALAAATSLKTAADGNIAMVSGTKFQRIYITDETGKIDTNPVGERDGRGRESILTGRYPALGVELEDFLRQVQNTPAVLIYRLARNGKLYMLGVSQLDITSTSLSKEIPAYFDQGAASSGDVRSSQNGILLGWKWTAAHGPIEYVGSVPLEAAA